MFNDINIDKYKNKWELVYLKIKIKVNNDSPELRTLHEYHEFARNITLVGHLCYKYNYNIIGQKLINTSTTIHYLVSLLIKNVVHIRYNSH